MIFVNLASRFEPLREHLGELFDRLEGLPLARATTFTEYVYDIEANWKLVYDNFQENYHLRFIHPRSSGSGTGPQNPFGYASHFGFHGPHRTQTIWINPDAPAPPPAMIAGFRRVMESAQRRKLPSADAAQDYFALFPNFFLLGSPVSPFSHTIYPVTPTRSRGVIRLYWVGADDSASERFGREFAMASVRDVHAEDRDVLLAGQKGLSSGAIEHIHFQTQEALCRHFYNTIEAKIATYQAERDLVEAAL